MFPPNIAKEAVELGPRTDHEGPHLVLLRGVELSPPEVLEWFMKSFVRRQVSRLYWLGSHIAPVSTKEGLIESIKEAGPPNGVVRIYCYPKSLEREIGEALPEEWELHPQNFSHVLMVVAADHQYRWDVVPASWLYRQTTEESKSFSSSVASAVNKIDEALEILDLRPAPGCTLGAAIDLGAAPGAWTMYLAGMCRQVLAVDPAEFGVCESSLPPHVTHLRMKAEDAVDQIATLLQGRGVDLLVSDMNQHPQRAAKAIAALLPLLKPGGYLVMTLKFYGIGRDRSARVKVLNDVFKEELQDGRCVWLLANTVNEQTYVARKGAGEVAQS